MFSALTSDFRKACRQTHKQTVSTHGFLVESTKKINQQEISFIKVCQKKSPKTVSHRKVTDPTGVFQQLLEWDGPAQHAVGGACVSAWSPWKAGAAASAASRSHVQLCNTITKTLVYQHWQEKNNTRETESYRFLYRRVADRFRCKD